MIFDLLDLTSGEYATLAGPHGTVWTSCSGTVKDYFNDGAYPSRHKYLETGYTPFASYIYTAKYLHGDETFITMKLSKKLSPEQETKINELLQELVRIFELYYRYDGNSPVTPLRNQIQIRTKYNRNR